MATRIDDLSLFCVDNGHGGEVDNDSISLTSTVQSVHDCDEQFIVHAILAERAHPSKPGAMQYLIQWDNYPMFRSTWEGIENISYQLLQEWGEQRRQEKKGLRVPFDLQIFEDARTKALQSSANRHNLRNEKRKRLDLPLTAPFPARYAGPGIALEANHKNWGSSDEAIKAGARMDPAIRELNTFSGIASTRLPSKSSASVLPARASTNNHQKLTLAKTSADLANKNKSVASPASLAPQFRRKRLKATRFIPTPRSQTSISGPAAPVAVRKQHLDLKEAKVEPTWASSIMPNTNFINQLKMGIEINDSYPSVEQFMKRGAAFRLHMRQEVGEFLCSMSSSSGREVAISVTGNDNLKIVCDPFFDKGPGPAEEILYYDRCFDLIDLGRPPKGDWLFSLRLDGHDKEMWLTIRRWRRPGPPEGSSRYGAVTLSLQYDRGSDSIYPVEDVCDASQYQDISGLPNGRHSEQAQTEQGSRLVAPPTTTRRLTARRGRPRRCMH